MDLYGFTINVNYDSSNKQIRVTTTIEIYGGGATDDIVNDWESAIEERWNGHQYEGRDVVFDVNVIVGNDKCKQGQNCIKVENTANCVKNEPSTSCVKTDWRLRWNRGEWVTGASDNTVAHEFGHLCGLPDDYETIGHWEWNWRKGELPKYIRDRTPPKAGHEGHLMATSFGNVNQHEIDDLIPNSIKREIKKEGVFRNSGG